MAFHLSASGQLSHTNTYLPRRQRFTSSNYEIHEPVGTMSLYMNSLQDIAPGHLVSFAETQTQTSIPDMYTVRESTDNDHTIGIVIEKAASPSDAYFTNKNHQHRTHAVRDHSHILRVARPGSIVYAWVVDTHENKFDGIYEKTINGSPAGLAMIQEVDDEHFIIKPLSDIESDVQELKSKFEALTN